MASRNDLQSVTTTPSIVIDQVDLEDKQQADADLSSLFDFDEEHLKPAQEKNAGEPKKRVRTSKKSPQNKNKEKPTTIDLDKQCGVLCPDGSQCPRIITCKAHTVAMKKAVFGRSMSFHQLVQIHQASNSRNRKKPAAQPNAAETAKKAATIPPVGTEAPAEESGQDEHSSEYDSDAEADAIMLALRGYEYRPIATYTPSFVSRKYRLSRMLIMQNPSYLEGGHHSLN